MASDIVTLDINGQEQVVRVGYNYDHEFNGCISGYSENWVEPQPAELEIINCWLVDEDGDEYEASAVAHVWESLLQEALMNKWAKDHD